MPPTCLSLPCFSSRLTQLQILAMLELSFLLPIREMSKREKEEDRIERIIRGLLKLPENRRCINCNSLGPQYVCTTFLTFICTNCSAIHREFTHRVKSVSMAKFNAEEVSALQAGGNERARQLYFKEWDPQRNSYPDSSNLNKVREFIKHVYVDRKYTGERSQEKLPRLKLGGREEPSEGRKDVYRCRSEDKTLRFYYDERRSPRYSKDNSRYGGYKKSPSRFEVVDTRFRDDDDVRWRRQFDSQKLSFRESKSESASPVHQKNMERSNLPVASPCKIMAKKSVQQLLIGERRKETDRKVAEGHAHNQVVTSSGSKATLGSNPVEQKRENTESLIELNSDNKSANPVEAPKLQENHPSADGEKCSSHESSAKENARPAPKPNTIEFLLLELSIPTVEQTSSVSEVPSNDNPSSVSGGNTLVSEVSAAMAPGQPSTSSNGTYASKSTSDGNMHAALAVPIDSSPAIPGESMLADNASGAVPVEQVTSASRHSDPVTGVEPASPVVGTTTLTGNYNASKSPLPTNMLVPSGISAQPASSAVGESTSQVPTVLQHSSLPTTDNNSMGQQTSHTPASTVNDQLRSSSSVPSFQGTSFGLSELKSPDVPKLTVDSDSRVKSSVPARPTATSRKELPADLFTASYSPVPGPITGWQTGQPYGMGFSMQQYPNPMQVPAYSIPAASANPFDATNETASAQAQPFSSMGNLRGTLPNVPSSGLLRSSSFDSYSTGLMTTESPSYASTMPSHTPFATAFSPGTYVGRQVHMNVPPARPQGVPGLGAEMVPSSLGHATHQPTSSSPLPAYLNSPPPRGTNPFG